MTKCLVVTAYTTLMCICLFSSSDAGAMTVAPPAGLGLISQEGNIAKRVRYVCRQTSNGPKCYNVSSSDRPRDYQQNGNGSNPYFQQRYTPSQYQSHPWGSPYGEH